MADFTKDLNKMFVRVSAQLNETQRNALITLSQENAKKIYFLEQTNEIMNRGIAYGINPGDKQLITNLQNWVGSDTDKPANVSTMIERLTALEAINVDVTGCADADKNSYLAYEDVNAGQAVQPKITLKIKPIDGGGALGTQKGLVDAQDAKKYIDDEVAKATTVVTEGKGIKVTSAEDNSDHHITYTVDSSLLLEYNAPSGGNSATITLTDGKGNSFGTVNVTDIIGNGVLQGTSYNPNTNVLTLTFKTATGGTQTVDVDLKQLIDINDVFIGTDSKKYLNVISDASTATFDTKMKDVSTASATETGLADAWQVKQYVDSKTLDLAVTANGDSYVSADASANNNKHIVVSTNIANLVANAGTPGKWTVSDAGEATNSGETAPTLTGKAGKLIDSAETATQVKTYVDGKVAIEAATRDAKIEAAIKSLDADINSTGDSNIGLNIKEVDGKLTTAAFTVTYAGVTQNGKGSDSTFVVTSADKEKLVKAKDLTSLQTHVEQKLKGALDSLDATVHAKDASTYIDFTVNEADGKLTDASIAVTYGTLSGADNGLKQHTGTEGIATTQVVADFVDGYDYWTTYTPA